MEVSSRNKTSTSAERAGWPCAKDGVGLFLVVGIFWRHDRDKCMDRERQKQIGYTIGSTNDQQLSSKKWIKINLFMTHTWPAVGPRSYIALKLSEALALRSCRCHHQALGYPPNLSSGEVRKKLRQIVTRSEDVTTQRESMS